MSRKNERKTITDPDSQAHVLGAGEPVIGLRLMDTNTQFDLPQQERVTIGADAGCDITLANPTVSSVHCVLERHARGWLLVDQGSKNGTRRGRHPCKEFPIEDGVMFLLGTLALVPFSAKSQRIRKELQRFPGYGASFQFRVERLLRAMQANQHLLLVGEPGSRCAEIARLIHDARDTTGPFVEIDRPVTTGADQVALLKAAHAGTLFVHQEMLPDDRDVLLGSLGTYRVLVSRFPQKSLVVGKARRVHVDHCDRVGDRFAFAPLGGVAAKCAALVAREEAAELVPARGCVHGHVGRFE